MKQISSIAACALCLAVVAAPAAANDNSTKIDQAGTGNSATVDQFGSTGSYVTVRQGQNWYDNSGSNNTVQVLQQGVHHSDVWISQSGSGNQHTVSQYNGDNLQVSINMNSSMWGDAGGDSNTVTVEQSGYEARAGIEQGGSRYSRAEVMQSGWDGPKMADIVQTGEGNQASIFQAGSNHASITQSGSNLNASIVQNSNGSGGYYGHGYGYAANTATIRQSH